MDIIGYTISLPPSKHVSTAPGSIISSTRDMSDVLITSIVLKVGVWGGMSLGEHVPHNEFMMDRLHSTRHWLPWLVVTPSPL